jgi:hypothetical protein
MTTAADMAAELRLIYAERRDAIPLLKNPEEQERRKARLPMLAAIGKLIADNPKEIDALITKGASDERSR